MIQAMIASPFLIAPRPLVIAHRGGSALAPENTIAAFDEGLRLGADALELDVHLSADGVPVVHHDARLDRTTDASGPIAARTTDELARVDAGARFVREGRTPFRALGIGIPTFADVLRRYPDTPVIVELKVNTVEMAMALLRVIRQADAVERVCAAGFGYRSLAAIRRAVPELATSASNEEVRLALYRSWVRWPVRRPAFRAYQVPEWAGRIRVTSPRFIRDAHRAGLGIQVWTVDERADMDRLLAWGVDGLISDCPNEAVRARDAFVARRAAPR